MLASQVAAGEVVERPASVVRELVDNSVDAGAGKIEVLVRRGGVSLIRVSDDGSGMGREDALLSLERHATSKIRTKEDLANIGTLGFRGEALPSIASVSRFRLSTRRRSEVVGTAIIVEGGKVVGVEDAGEAPGTQIEVRALFFNVPARRKFLRAESTEFGHIEHAVRLQAIAHPEISFTLIHNERICFQLPAAEGVEERIRGLAGAETAGQLVPVGPATRRGVTVGGFVGRAGMARSGKSAQLVFVNRRPVENGMLHYGLREGYRGALGKGQYPVTFLFLEMDPREVDFNVHPAKKEVRFLQGIAVRDAVAEAVAAALAPKQAAVVPAVPSPQPGDGGEAGEAGEVGRPPVPRPVFGGQPEQRPLVPEAEQHALRRDWAVPPMPVAPERAAPEPSASAPVPVGETPQPAAPAQPTAPGQPARRRVPHYEFLTTLDGGGFVVLKGEEGLVLMDQRAAHERVLYERLRRQLGERGVASQRLLMPLTLQLSPKDFDFVQQNREAIHRTGVGMEAFGANTVKIDSLPALMKQKDPAAFVDGVIHELKLASDSVSSVRLTDDHVVAAVCRLAVRQGDLLHAEELSALLGDLLACEMPYCCPQGKPTLVQISGAEIARKFGR
ncbi:DNA mismatch repair endonuclease MutL [soil metagenome]